MKLALACALAALSCPQALLAPLCARYAKQRLNSSGFENHKSHVSLTRRRRTALSATPPATSGKDHSPSGLATSPPPALVVSWIQRAGREGRWKHAVTYMEDAVDAATSRGELPNVQLCNAVIQALGACGQWRMAVQLLRNIETYNVTADAFSYGNAIQACVLARQLQVAQQLLADMKQAGLPRNAVIYGMLMKAVGYDISSDGTHALQLLDDMQQGKYHAHTLAKTAAYTSTL
jgi:Pentatricopeptide repeat domain